MRLFRAVEGEELKDVLRFGDYNIHPNSTFKRFAFAEGDLDAFIQGNPGRSYTKTFVDIPTSKLQFMFEHADPARPQARPRSGPLPPRRRSSARTEWNCGGGCKRWASCARAATNT